MSDEAPDLSIGEVLALLQDEFPDVTISKIRFLESQGLLEPERTPSGYRVFRGHDVDRLRWILLEQRENFLPLKVIRERLGAGDFDRWVADGAEGTPPPPVVAMSTQPTLGLEDPDDAGTSSTDSTGDDETTSDRPRGETPGKIAETADPPGGGDVELPTVEGAADEPDEDRPAGEAVGDDASASAPEAGGGGRHAAEVAASNGETGAHLGPGATDAAGSAGVDDASPVEVSAVGTPTDQDQTPTPSDETPTPSDGGADGGADEGTERDDAGDPPTGGGAGVERDVLLAAARRIADGLPGAPVERQETTGRRGAGGPPQRVEADMLDPGPSTVEMTVDELARAAGLSPPELGELERYGLLSSHQVGPARYYDGEALVIAKLAAAFSRHGVEARHLRMYLTAAQREAGMFEQVVSPLIGRHDPVARREARDRLVEMARLGEALHAALLRTSLTGIGWSSPARGSSPPTPSAASPAMPPDR